MRFDTLARAEHHMAELGVAQSYRDTLVSTARPAIGFARYLMDDTDAQIGISRIGGRPDLPPGFSWPCRGRGKNVTVPPTPLAFISQINLDQLASYIPDCDQLPRTGMLYLFVDSWNEAIHRAEGPFFDIRLCHVDVGEDHLERRDVPAAISDGWNVGYFHFGAAPLRRWPSVLKTEVLIPRDITTLNEIDCHQLETHEKRFLAQMRDRERPIPAPSLEALQNEPSVENHTLHLWGDQLLGWPTPIETAFGLSVSEGLRRTDQASDPRDRDWTHLMTVQGNSVNPFSLCRWPGGHLYVCIRNADLEAQAFDKAFAFAQYD